MLIIAYVLVAAVYAYLKECILDTDC